MVEPLANEKEPRVASVVYTRTHCELSEGYAIETYCPKEASTNHQGVGVDVKNCSLVDISTNFSKILSNIHLDFCFKLRSMFICYIAKYVHLEYVT